MKHASPCLAALLLLQTLALAAVPEGFAVLGERIPVYPPPKGFVEVAQVEKRLPPPPSKEDRATGCMVYSRDYGDAVHKQSAPELHEITDELIAFAAPGEYEPWCFSVYALRDLRDVRATVGALRGPAGATIPADRLDLRVLGWVWTRKHGATYAYDPGYFEKLPTVAIPREESRRFWITVKVPDDAKPGVYEGRVRLTADGRERPLRLRLRVLPFKLDPAPYMGSLLAPSLQMYGEYYGRDMREKIVDLREHGHGDAWGYFLFAPAFRGGPADDPRLDFDTPAKPAYHSCNAIVAALREAKALGPIYVNQMGRVYAGYAGRYGKKDFEKAFVAMVRKTHEHARANNWPPLYIGYGDEPSHSTKRLQRCRRLFRLIAEGGGSPTSYLCGGYFGVKTDLLFWPYMKVVHTNYFDEDVLRRIRLQRQRLWLYNVGLGRFEHGWQCIVTGAELVTHYDYQTRPRSDRGAFKYCAAAGDAKTKKPIPGWRYECSREGIDDGRYYATLVNHIARARVSRDREAMLAAKAAEKTLDEWISRIPPHRLKFRAWQKNLGLSSRDLHRMRWRMARHILELRNQTAKFRSEPWYR